jgi:hypothetical protein
MKISSCYASLIFLPHQSCLLTPPKMHLKYSGPFRRRRVVSPLNPPLCYLRSSYDMSLIQHPSPSLLCLLLMANTHSLVRSPPRSSSPHQCGLQLSAGLRRVDTAHHVRLVRRAYPPLWIFFAVAGTVHKRVGWYQDRKVRLSFLPNPLTHF